MGGGKNFYRLIGEKIGDSLAICISHVFEVEKQSSKSTNIICKEFFS